MQMAGSSEISQRRIPEDETVEGLKKMANKYQLQQANNEVHDGGN